MFFKIYFYNIQLKVKLIQTNRTKECTCAEDLVNMIDRDKTLILSKDAEKKDLFEFYLLLAFSTGYAR